jgi:hypothetical protein
MRTWRAKRDIAVLVGTLSWFTVGLADGAPRQAGPKVPDASPIAGYRVESAFAYRPADPRPLVALRTFSIGGRGRVLLVDPETLETSLARADEVRLERMDPSVLRARLAETPYGRALVAGRRNEESLVGAGVSHLRTGRPGINLTVDLCPSSRPLDRRLFLTLLDELERAEQPVPVAVAITGAWMREHSEDLDWLAGLDRSRRLSVTWVNHTDHHRTDPARPLASNFLLEPGTNVIDEVLAAEWALLERGLVPSVFFRFPGLVSSRMLVDTVESLGLVPVGSDAWLAKGERPGSGSIVLVHGNGNEPLGVRRFIELLHQERANVRDGRWLLLDLRQSVAGSTRTP